MDNYMMSPRRGATAGARENMNRALNPGEREFNQLNSRVFTFEEFQSEGQSCWTCSKSFLYESDVVDPKVTGQLTSRSDAVSIHCTPRGMPDFQHTASRLENWERPHNPRGFRWQDSSSDGFRWQEHTRRPSSAWPAAQQPANGVQALGREPAILDAMAPEIASPKNALAAPQGGRRARRLCGGLDELQRKYEESSVDRKRLPVAGTAHAGLQEMITECEGRDRNERVMGSLPPSPPAALRGKPKAEGAQLQPMCGAPHAQPLQTDLDQRIATTSTVSMSVPTTQSRPVLRSRGVQGSREEEEAVGDQKLSKHHRSVSDEEKDGGKVPARGELDAETLPAKLLRTVGPPGPTPDSEEDEESNAQELDTRFKCIKEQSSENDSAGNHHQSHQSRRMLHMPSQSLRDLAASQKLRGRVQEQVYKIEGTKGLQVLKTAHLKPSLEALNAQSLKDCPKPCQGDVTW